MAGSESPWMVIRTLVAAFTTQQFLEGMDGCKVQEGFNGKFRAVSRISALFAGVATGIGMLSSENRPMVVIVDGVFNTGSAGVTAYMCLLDLYCAYFTMSEMQRRGALKIWKYMAILSSLWDSSFLTKWI